ncbi:MAG: Na/Pi cotransporter family protein [Campylobacterales bacterium]|nr:Na/Pi cotransporter family protein [Campylobacterales bacterium]
MYRKLFYPLFLLALAYLLFASNDAKIIVSGIAIFLIGMFFMEDGFKLFSGGVLEKVLEKATNTVPKAIGTGLVATSIVQSSSLISIIVISFLSAELISLSGAIGVIFGSNIGTTTTAWIVSAFGVKIKIEYYALPMIIFGVIFKFSSNKTTQGLGFVLMGLGFVFLGIGYMKDGFETLKEGINLADFAMEGYLGALVYILIGVIATIVIQSSSATLALIITALATNQITYLNGLELAIGANIGTTVTAVIGALASNENGKRLAVAHFIFNIITAFVAVVFLYQLAQLVTVLSGKIGIDPTDYAMQLSLFHTIFNIIGVLIVAPFTHKLVAFLETLFINEDQENIQRAKSLDTILADVPEAAMASIKKEVIHLYDNAVEVISHALYLHRHTYINQEDIEMVVTKNIDKIETDIDQFYHDKIKYLYGDILSITTKISTNMSEDQKQKMYSLKVACRDIVEAIKDVRELQKNINIYIKSKNNYVKVEYNNFRVQIAKVINEIEQLKLKQNDAIILSKVVAAKEHVEQIDMITNGKIDKLIRENLIDTTMATSLINDSNFSYDIAKRLLNVATVIWMVDYEMSRALEDEESTYEN